MIARRLWSNGNGASAAEFALVLPILILTLLGIIDAGRWLWNCNSEEKAAQIGARAAVVTDVVPNGFVGYSYAGKNGLSQGDVIPPADWTVTCTSTPPCTASGADASLAPPVGTSDTAAFNRVVNRMAQIMPDITAANVTIAYSSAGLGYAGNPNGTDVVPLVMINITGLKFKWIASGMLAQTSLPDVHSSLTLEDGTGTQFN